MLYASTETLRCFECGDIGHKHFSCPHKARNPEGEGPSDEPQIVTESTPQQPEKTDINTEVRQVSENIVHDDEVPSCSDVVGKGEVCGDPVQDKEVHDEQSEDMDDLSEETEESCRDDDSCADFDVVNCGSDLYSPEQINVFLDETKGRKVEIGKIFPI